MRKEQLEKPWKRRTEERLEKQRAEKQEQEERQYNLKIDGKDVDDLTGKMDGKGFTKKVSDGDKVHAGDILVEADLEEIKNAGYQTTTMMILTNTDEFGNVTKAEPAEVKTTSKVMTLTK